MGVPSGLERKADMMRSTWTMSVSGGAALFTILLVQSTATQQQLTEKIDLSAQLLVRKRYD